MTQLTTIRTKSGATLAALGVASLVAACGSSGHHAAAASATPASDHTLRVSLTSGHLTGANGHALYLWDADRHDKSNCSGACAAAWPPLLSRSRPSAGRGVKASDLSTIARHGGARQVTYEGHPLYYFAGDSRGSTRGQGSDGFGARWWLVSSSGSAITHSSGKSKSTSSGSSGGGGW
ncbi:MAG: COG4315 family predicted lipoprotein [Solirubrobacteraceae bacterium]